MTSRFGYILVKSALAPTGTVFRNTIKNFTDPLEELGGVEWSAQDLENPLPLFYLMTTGGTEQALLDLRAQRAKSINDEPVFILAHPAYNSLPASIEVLARLQQDDEKGRVFYMNDPEDSSCFNQIQATLHDLDVSVQLKDTRIGLVGSPSDWLVASSPDPELLQKTWGPTIIPVSMDEINASIDKISLDALPPIRDPLVDAASEVREPSREDLDNVVRVYLALKESIKTHDIQALTLRCFDLVLGLRTTGCFGLAQLIDEGIIAGCEGDLVSTVGMLWVQKLLDQTPWMANPTQLDEATNSLWLAHCTVPRGMVKDYGLRSHFESGLGVGIQGTLANGPVTLVRIGGKRMEKIWLAEGEIVEAGSAEDLCRTQAQIKLTKGSISDLLTAPLGNHLIMVQGNHAERLESWWRVMIA